MVIVIDRSASMSARDVVDGSGARTRLDDAKARARRVIDDLFSSGGPRSAAVVAFAAEARDLTGFTTDAGRLRLAIDQIAASDQPGDLAAALRLVDAMTATPPSDDQGSPDAPPIVLLTDGSFAGADQLPALASPVRYIAVGPGSAGPDGAGGEPEGYANVGIVALSARRDYDNPSVLRVFARVQSASARPHPAGLSLSLNAEVASRRAVVIPGARPAGPEAGAALEPGQATVTFEVQTADAALIALALDGADDLEADNTAAMTVAAAARPRVLLVVPDADVSAGSLLEDNLAEMRLGSLRKLGAGDYEALSASDLSGLDLIIFDRAAPRRLPPAPTISMGAGLPLPGLSLTPPKDGGGATYFLSWDRSHPLMRAVTPDTVIVARPLSLTYQSPATGGAILTEIARGSAGPLIALLQAGRVRHLVLAFDPAESTWPLHPGYTVFLASAIDFLTLRGDASAGRYFTTGAAARAAWPGEGSGRRLMLTGPAEVTVEVPAGASAGEEVSVGRLERAGVYRVTGAPSGPGGLVCINLLNETESAIRVEPGLQISGRPVRPYTADSTPREVWPWFVAAATVLLVVEWFLYAARMRV